MSLKHAQKKKGYLSGMEDTPSYVLFYNSILNMIVSLSVLAEIFPP